MESKKQAVISQNYNVKSRPVPGYVSNKFNLSIYSITVPVLPFRASETLSKEVM